MPLWRAGAQRRGVERIDAAVHGERGMKRETEQAALLEPFVERRHAPGQIQQRAADRAVAAHLPNKAVLLVQKEPARAVGGVEQTDGRRQARGDRAELDRHGR